MNMTMLLSTVIGLALLLSGCANEQSPKPDDASVHGSVGAEMQSKNLSGAAKIRPPL
jgi:PBP1b-binding outer membrane lipoprotein LpoB